MIFTNNRDYKIEDYKLNYRACIPFYILLDPDLSRNHLILYGLIEQMESSKGDVFYSNESLAKIIGIDARSVQRLKTLMQSKKYIKRELKIVKIKGRFVELHCWNTVKGALETNYTEDDIDSHPMNKNNTRGDTDGHGGGDRLCHGGGDTDGHPCNTHDLKSHNINLSLGHPADARENESDSPPKEEPQPPSNQETTFAKFWTSYPVKKSKQLAYKTWIKLNPDEILINKILDDLEIRKTQDEEWLNNFIPRAAKYLIEKVYEDEIKNKRCAKERKIKEADKLSEQRAKIQDEINRNNQCKKTDAEVFKIVATHTEASKAAVNELLRSLKCNIPSNNSPN